MPYWKVSEFSVSVKIRTKSSLVKLWSSTDTGNLPCNSGIKSSIDDTWNAPAAINKMKSVLIGPYLVTTVLPSTIGKISRCTPSRDTSAPWELPLPAILSISSMNTIPSFSARYNASAFIASSSTSLEDSSPKTIWNASFTANLRFFFFGGSISPKILPIEIAAPPGISSMGCVTSSTSISITKLSYSPRRKPSNKLFSNTSRASSPFSSFFASASARTIRFCAATVALAFTSSSFSAFTSR